MLAAESGHYDSVELLLQHGADTEERNLVQLSVCLSVRALTVAILNHFDEIWHRRL